jgi:hypothetical protein
MLKNTRIGIDAKTGQPYSPFHTHEYSTDFDETNTDVSNNGEYHSHFIVLKDGTTLVTHGHYHPFGDE